MTTVCLGAYLSVHGAPSRALMSEAASLVAENLTANEAGLRRKENDYRAEMVRIQGTVSYNLKYHKILEEEHSKILEQLGEVDQTSGQA